MDITELKVGKIALIQQTEDGRIVQIGLTHSQSDTLQDFLAMISSEKPLVKMPEAYELVLKSSVNNLQ